MAQVAQENLLAEWSRFEYDSNQAKEKARELLRSVLPEDMWAELEEKGVMQCSGKRGLYIISPFSQTEIRSGASGRSIAYACLQLSIPAPAHDRMAAEYLLIRNAEDLYWKTANIFFCNGHTFGIGTLLLIAFDIALFVKILFL